MLDSWLRGLLGRANKQVWQIQRDMFDQLTQSIDGIALLVNLYNRDAKQYRWMYNGKEQFMEFLALNHPARWLGFDELEREVLYIRTSVGDISFHSGRLVKRYPVLIDRTYIWQENNSQAGARELIDLYWSLNAKTLEVSQVCLNS